MSELASALGTEALSAGSARDARKLFATSLAEPTENAVAQAEWASRQGARIELSADVLDEVRNSYEAHAQIASEKGDSDIAIQNAWLWLKDEPFASIPAIFGSHEASMAREYEEAILFAEVGLVANPQEFLLRNNLAFAMASVGRVDDAEVQLGEIHASALSARDALVYKATRGLIAFRKGAVAEGRQLYEETIRGTNDPIMRAIAAIVLAREEILAETPNGVFARGLAESLADEAKASPAQARKENLLGWLAHLERELSGARG
jgi:hypothetical protein